MPHVGRHTPGQPVCVGRKRDVSKMLTRRNQVVATIPWTIGKLQSRAAACATALAP